jgi:hypothetical protein
MLEPRLHIDDDMTVALFARDDVTEKATDRGVGAAESASAAVPHTAHDHESDLVGTTN